MNLFAMAERLEFRPLADLGRDELLTVLAIRNEDPVRRNMYTCHVIGEAEHFAWAERAVGDETMRFFALVLDGEIIGATQFNVISTTHKRADWGAYLSSRCQGKGLGAAMEVATLDYAFGPLGLEKLNGEVMAFNDRALKVHLGIGFVEEGRRRRHILRNGAWIDIHLIGITREEWSERGATPSSEKRAA
jgi:UDP-4-amino-4,6-dideoxy-N-acetyl-beta-L-altrosamine N-acetyltransferase